MPGTRQESPMAVMLITALFREFINNERDEFPFKIAQKTGLKSVILLYTVLVMGLYHYSKLPWGTDSQIP